MTHAMIQKFKDNYLLGSIKYRGEQNLYLMPIAWWILNYKKYDPFYNPNDWEFVFRNNILNVTDNNIEQFIDCIKIDKVDLDELIQVLPSLPTNYKHVCFFIDLDNKEFITDFMDIDLEDYMPSASWKFICANPINYLSYNIQHLLK